MSKTLSPSWPKQKLVPKASLKLRPKHLPRQSPRLQAKYRRRLLPSQVASLAKPSPKTLAIMAHQAPGAHLAALGARGTSMAVRIASSQGSRVSGSNPKTNGPSTSWPWMALRSEKPLAKGLAICIGWKRDLPKGSQMRMALCQRPR